VTRWITADGEKVWRATALGGKLPLYGCEHLNDNPSAPVVFTQDERSSEQAADFFAPRLPGILGVGLISVPGALERTELQQMAGRDVYLLPNTGANGDAFLESATKLLGALTPPANVETITITKTYVEHWAAEALDDDARRNVSTEGWGFVHYLNAYEYGIGFDITISGAPLASPAFASPGNRNAVDTPETRKAINENGFIVKSTGLYVEKFKDGEPTWDWIASPIYVMALARTPGSVDWGVCLDSRGYKDTRDLRSD
jgi:hypothetical protein